MGSAICAHPFVMDEREKVRGRTRTHVGDSLRSGHVRAEQLMQLRFVKKEELCQRRNRQGRSRLIPRQRCNHLAGRKLIVCKLCKK